jgi:hypothetical protein
MLLPALTVGYMVLAMLSDSVYTPSVRAKIFALTHIYWTVHFRASAREFILLPSFALSSFQGFCFADVGRWLQTFRDKLLT